MSLSKGIFCTVFAVLLLLGVTNSAPAMGPRYALYDRGSVLEVQTPNILRIRMQGKNRIETVRLLGVGTPRNKDRIKGLSPEFVWYLQKENLWELSRTYIRSLLTDKVVEVWTRRWDELDEKNRRLVYVRVPRESADAVDVNGEIIKSGMGFVTRDYVHVTFATYRTLEEEARKNRRGLWRGLSEGRLSALGKRADPAGPLSDMFIR